MSSVFISRLAGLAVVVGFAFGGCTCESRGEAPVAATPAAPLEEAAVAPPIGGAVKGNFCPGPGAAIDPPSGAYRRGKWSVEKRANWEDPPDASSRFINTPGLRDGARGADVSWMVRHRIPNDRYVVLTAKEHEFPAGTTFDEAGKRKAFDEVAASPHAMLLGVKAVTWAGLPAIEGTVAAVPERGPRTMVHHIILPLEGTKALVVSYIAMETQFHEYLGEACDAVSAAK